MPGSTRGNMGIWRDGRPFYGWILVGITAFVLAVVISPILQGIGTFFVALEDEFGWSRTLLAGAFSLARAEDTIVGPLVGYLTDRVGTRRLVLIGFVVLAAGFFLLGSIQTVVGFYGAFIVITAGAGFAGFLPLMGAINHWFVRYRTTAMGMAQAGVSIGGLLVPALAWSITTFGWRNTSYGMGVLMLLLAVPVSAAIRNRPEDHGLLPDGDAPGEVLVGDGLDSRERPAVDPGDHTLAQALRSRAFWLIALAHAFAAVAFLTLGVHAIPMITDRDVSLGVAASVVATYTAVAGVFQIGGGIVGDRVPKRLAIAAFMSIQTAGVLVAALARSTPMMFVFAVLFGIGAGGRIPLLIAIRSDYFGRSAFATIFGFSTLPMSVILIAGPVLTGYLFDTLGSYTVPLLGLCGLGLVGVVLILLVPRAPVAAATATTEP